MVVVQRLFCTVGTHFCFCSFLLFVVLFLLLFFVLFLLGKLSPGSTLFPCCVASFQIPFYGALQVVVYEKEHRLRTIMRMMGLTSNVYWLTTYALEVLKYIIILSLVYIFGALVGLKYFLKHDMLLMWLCMVLWANVCVMFAFFISMFFTSTKASSAVGFLFLLFIGEAGQNTMPWAMGIGST